MHFPIDSGHRLTFLISWLILLIFTKCRCKFLACVSLPVEVGGCWTKPVRYRGPRQILLLHLRSTLPTVFTLGGRGGGPGPRHRGAAWRWRSPSCRSRRCRRSRPMHVICILSPLYCWSRVLTEETLGPAASLPPRWWCWRQVCSCSLSSEHCPSECRV